MAEGDEVMRKLWRGLAWGSRTLFWPEGRTAWWNFASWALAAGVIIALNLSVGARVARLVVMGAALVVCLLALPVLLRWPYGRRRSPPGDPTRQPRRDDPPPPPQ